MKVFFQIIGVLVVMFALAVEIFWFAEAAYREWGKLAGGLAYLAFWATFVFAERLGGYYERDKEARKWEEGN